MNILAQAAHVMRKDIHRFWPLLLLFFVILILLASLGTEATGWSGGQLSGVSYYLGAPGFTLLLAVLGAVVLQEDPLAGDRPFWITRPLSPVAILLAKAGFIGAFLFVPPLLVQGWLLSGYEPGSALPLFVLDSALAYGMVFMVILVAAAVTSDQNSLVVLLLGATFVLGILGALIPSQFPSGSEYYRIEATASVLRDVGTLVVGGGLLAHQALTRRTGRTFALAVGAFVILGAFSRFSNLDLTGNPMEPRERWVVEEPEAFSLELNRISYSTNDGDHPGAGFERLETHLQLEGPSDLLPRLTDLSVRLQGPRMDQTLRSMGARLQPDPAYPLWEMGELQWAHEVKPPQPTSLRIPIIEASPEEMDRFRGKVRHMEVTASFDTFRPVVLGQMPLKEGQEVTTPRGVFSVSRSTTGGYSHFVDVSGRWVRSRLWSPEIDWMRPAEDPALALVNWERGEAHRGFFGRSAEVATGLLLLSGPQVQEFSSWLSFPRSPRGDGEAFWIDEEWLAGAELVIIGFEYVGSFEKTVLVSEVEWPNDGTYFISYRHQPSMNGAQPITDFLNGRLEPS